MLRAWLCVETVGCVWRRQCCVQCCVWRQWDVCGGANAACSAVCGELEHAVLCVVSSSV
jgi:hypothetical protein